jgi:hypothetical protein
MRLSFRIASCLGGSTLLTALGCAGADASSAPDAVTLDATDAPADDASLDDAEGATAAEDSSRDATASPDDASPADSAAAADSGDDAAAFTGNPTGLCTPVPVNGDRTSAPLAAPPPGAAGVSFLTDWPGIPAGGGYRYTQIMDACRMHLDGSRTGHGSPALRVEVRPGDDPLALGSERAEALLMQNSSGGIYENASSGTQYYATSYYFPNTWDGTFLQGDSQSWSFIFQLYGASALSAGRHHTPGPQIYQLTLGGQTYDFSNGSIGIGQWTDWILLYTWATTATGHVTVWRRDQGQIRFQQVLDVANVVTLPSANTASYYWKQGLYRGPNVQGRIDVFWIGPSARGATFAAVENAAFGTQVGP